MGFSGPSLATGITFSVTRSIFTSPEIKPLKGVMKKQSDDSFIVQIYMSDGDYRFFHFSACFMNNF